MPTNVACRTQCQRVYSYDVLCKRPVYLYVLYTLKEFASESEESETDVNIENEYYQAKAAKEDNPQAAIAGFERVG